MNESQASNEKCQICDNLTTNVLSIENLTFRYCQNCQGLKKQQAREYWDLHAKKREVEEKKVQPLMDELASKENQFRKKWNWPKPLLIE